MSTLYDTGRQDSTLNDKNHSQDIFLTSSSLHFRNLHKFNKANRIYIDSKVAVCLHLPGTPRFPWLRTAGCLRSCSEEITWMLNVLPQRLGHVTDNTSPRSGVQTVQEPSLKYTSRTANSAWIASNMVRSFIYFMPKKFSTTIWEAIHP